MTSLYQNARFFANLTNTGEYRFNFDLGANTKLTRWLTWNGSISNRYLSNPILGAALVLFADRSSFHLVASCKV